MKNRSAENVRICGCGNCHDAATMAHGILAKMITDDTCAYFAAMVGTIIVSNAVTYLSRKSHDEDGVPTVIAAAGVVQGMHEDGAAVADYIRDNEAAFLTPLKELFDRHYELAQKDAIARDEDRPSI